jgi:hypothetical protein
VVTDPKDLGSAGGFRRAARFFGLIEARPQPDEGLSFRQRVWRSGRRELRQWPFWLWVVVVFTLANSARWYVTLSVALGLGIGLVVLAALWQVRRERRQPPTLDR